MASVGTSAGGGPNGSGWRRAPRLALGAPGIYRDPQEDELRLEGLRMDVAAFVGVAPRGPAGEPELEEFWRYDRPCVEIDRPRRRSVAVPVESFAEYRRLFGGFDGPARLPHAVAAFFEQGGRRAYVVRIVHDHGDPVSNAAATAWGPMDGALQELSPAVGDPLPAPTTLRLATGEPVGDGDLLRLTLPDGTIEHREASVVTVVPGAVEVELDQQIGSAPEMVERFTGAVLVARSEGSWGDGLEAALGFSSDPIRFIRVGPLLDEAIFRRDEAPPPGSLLRFLVGGVPQLRFVTVVRRIREDDPALDLSAATLDNPLPAAPERTELVLGNLEIRLPLEDGTLATESHEGLGLSLEHPRWIATVLCYESELVFPHASWAFGSVEPAAPDRLPREPSFEADPARAFAGGVDRYEEIVPEDFFDSGWVLGDPEPGSGVHSLTHLQDLSQVVAPDLYDPIPFVRVRDIRDEPPVHGPTFERCVDLGPPGAQAEPEPGLDGLRLDPRIPADLDTIVDLQTQLLELADQLTSWVVLLDAPPGLRHRQLMDWRARLSSSYAAAYHPWLRAARPDGDGTLLRLNPSAAAAGIIAARELAFGVPHGPANSLARSVVDVEEVVAPNEHDELHPAGVNVYLRERDGVLLTGARTLARDQRLRQLSVRRLMVMIRRVLEQQMHWMVFENNGPALRAEVRQLLGGYLRTLFRAGAFTGATEKEAFFVRCDEALNPQRVIDAGQLIAEVGVAPSEPIEFIVVRLVRSGDGTLLVEA